LEEEEHNHAAFQMFKLKQYITRWR